MTANLTRRRMLAAAGIGTAAAAFSGAASAQCRNDLKWDETHEIVVVGAGGAGMAAAVKAAQTGAKDILVLEKLAFTGGNTLIAQGFINAADPVRQPRQGIKDSPENHMKQTLAAGDFRGDPERVKVLCDNAYGAITWLESLGMKFKDNVIQIFGALYPRSHIPALPKGQGYGTVLTKAAKELGVQVRTGLGVTEIIREEQFAGRVIGVKVQPAKGPARFIRATKAVVLAAGGFSGNRYLRELHDPRVKGLGTDNLPGSTGEVAMAAVRVGAYLVGMDFIQSTPGAPAGKKMKLLLNFNVNGSIYVDKRGNRIVNEGERRDVIRDAVLGTPERYGYTDHVAAFAFVDELHELRRGQPQGHHGRHQDQRGLDGPDNPRTRRKDGRRSRRPREDDQALQRGLRQERPRRRLPQAARQPHQAHRGRSLLGLLHRHDGPSHDGRHQHQRQGSGP